MRRVLRLTPPFLAFLCLAAGALAAEPDYAAYGKLLAERVSALTLNGYPVATTFDYVGLHTRPMRTSDVDTLADLERGMLAVRPSGMSRPERTAWAINLYNLLVIERVLTHFDQDGKPPASVDSVPGFFEQPCVTVEGRRYSLDGFERRFLFGDSAARDPRVLFALGTAARGSPILVARPYQAATLDRDLDDVTSMSLSGRKLVRPRIGGGRFEISRIFERHERDFGGRAGVIAFLVRHGPADLRVALAARGDSAIAGFIPWDGRLNQSSEEMRMETRLH